MLTDAFESKIDSIKANQKMISHSIPQAKQQPSNTLMFNDFSIEFIHDGQEEDDGLVIPRIQSTKERNRPR